MSEIKRPLKAFVYHAPGDKARVRDLYLRLIHDGVDAWVVKDKLLPGQDWKQELQNAVFEADVVLVCVSEQFEREEFRQRQTRLALDAVLEGLEDKSLILPIRLDDCPVPPSLGKRQPVNFFEESRYDRLLDALRLRANEVDATFQIRESSLSQITTPRVQEEQPTPEKKPVEATPGIIEIVDGAGILIEGTPVKQHKPARAIVLSLLGFGVLVMLALLGPSWIENSESLTTTPEIRKTLTSTPRAEVSPAVSPKAVPIPTLVEKGNVSHLVFLIDTSGSMQGKRIRMVKSAASKFVSRLGDQYVVSVLEFDTNVELRLASGRDHAAASEAIQSILVEVPHNGSCVYDAFYAGIQQAALTPSAENTESMIILLTDVAVGENVGWNCSMRLMDDFLSLVWNLPHPIFSIYVGDDFEPNSFLTWPAGEGAIRSAVTEQKIGGTLLSIAEAAGLDLKPESVTPAQSADALPLSMVLVPAGEFLMGDNIVTLDAYWIDKTEVTNGMYARCVQAGRCSAPRSSRSNTRDQYFGNLVFDDYPVIYVSWENANAYCGWAGGRLPTEAEWEKTARGTDGRPFPWGDVDPAGTAGLLNYRAQDTTEVGSYPDGASPYGALDMAGNVSEWVEDWLSTDYYNNPPASNPIGPYSGEYRVWRGGSWAHTSTDMIHTYGRTGNLPTDVSGGLGFRCARDAGP